VRLRLARRATGIGRTDSETCTTPITLNAEEQADLALWSVAAALIAMNVIRGKEVVTKNMEGMEASA
jgi:hypothetical protein